MSNEFLNVAKSNGELESVKRYIRNMTLNMSNDQIERYAIHLLSIYTVSDIVHNHVCDESIKRNDKLYKVYDNTREKSIIKNNEKRKTKLRVTKKQKENRLIIIGALVVVMGISGIASLNRNNISYKGNDNQIGIASLVDSSRIGSIVGKYAERDSKTNIKYYDTDGIAQDIVKICDKNSNLTDYVINDVICDLIDNNSLDLAVENINEVYDNLKIYSKIAGREDLNAKISEKNLLDYLVRIYSSPSHDNYEDLVNAVNRYNNYRHSDDDPFKVLKDSEKRLIRDLINECVKSHDTLYEEHKDEIESLQYEVSGVSLDNGVTR